MNWPNLTEENYRKEVDRYVDSMRYTAYDATADKGIVICAGGQRLLTNTYVNITVLRKLGCTLPIEVWYRNRWELDAVARAMFDHLGPIEFRRGDAQPMEWRTLNGWELKPYAILNSRFARVLLLDADNTPVRNPTFLFDTPEFQEHGALFWPDYWRTEPARGIWRMCDVEYRNEPEFESGQAVIDRHRCWPALYATKFMNDYSDLTYIHIHGDKDTFRFGWHMTGTPFHVCPFGIHSLESTMCQHDWKGERLFQHRNMQKWEYEPGRNHPIRGFMLESECFEALEELRSKWDGHIGIDGGRTDEELAIEESLVHSRWLYRRVSYDERPMVLESRNRIGEGRGGCEEVWYIDGDTLVIGGRSQTTAVLNRNGEGWKGKWIVHEGMPVELLPV
ncbi:MAG: hypothetical protein O3A51_07175 [Verrucomicrobia bacterium]|nr:hypothetical protein [Verrucomicrobiota bacterium]